MLAWEKKRERQLKYLREYMVTYRGNPEKLAQIRKLDRERRSTPEYKQYAREYKRKERATPEGKRRGREGLLRRKYGLTVTQWEDIFVAQGSCCAICESTEPNSKKGWHTDHCHNTGKVRGIICPPCNKALGLFKENLKSLKAAINYLKSNKS
jgi:Recombination endonuclease VII